MRSRGLQSSDDAASRGTWTRRVILGGLGTAGATVALAAFAASAFANAANPLPDAHGSITPVGGGAVRVDVSGTWNWGQLSGSSVQKSCAGRSGVAWSVDWWGLSGSKTATAIPGLTGTQVNPVTNSNTAPTTFTGNLDPVANFAWSSSGGQFHTSHLFNGFDADLCKAPNTKDANGFPEGPWSASATYPHASDVPAKLCVNFYDPHGQEGDYSTSTSDNFADKDGDNSIKTNSFDPTLLKGYCFTPQFTLSMNVDKNNDANQDGTYSKSEQAKVAGQTVSFQVTVENTSAVAEVVDSVTDEVPTGAAGAPVACKDSSNNNIVGQTIAVGHSVTCTFTQSNYAPATGSLEDKVNVTVHESGNAGNSLTDSSTSTVTAPPAAAHLAANILLCSDPNFVLPNDGTLVTSGGTTVVPPANDVLASTKVDPDTYTVTATAPTGYHLAVCGNYNGSDHQSATLHNGDSATLNFFVVKNGSPNVTVAKDGPADGDLNGNGTYSLVATNSGDADSVAGTFTDTLPDGEQFVSFTAPAGDNCSAVGQVVTCDVDALAKNGGKATYTVTVKYTKTGALKDCATIQGQAVPSCVTTNVHTPNVTVAKDGPANGDLNGNGTYTIVATNNGDADSVAGTFTDTLPDGEQFVSFTGPAGMNCSAVGQVVTCDVGVLAKNGGKATYTVTVKYTKTGDLKDCATIAGQAVPSCVTTHVGQPDVSVAKTGPADGDLNGNGTYTIVATNNGDSDSKAGTFTDTLPDGEQFVSFTGPAGMNCSAVGQVVTCDVGVLAKNGGHATYTVTVKYTKTGALKDCATIAGQPVPSCVTTNVHSPSVTVKKTGPAVGALNGNGTYTIVATNNGDGASKAGSFTDTLPDGEQFVSFTGPAGMNCSAVGQVVTCDLGPLAANGGFATYTVTVKYTKTGDLTDCATINGQAVPSCVTTHIPGTPSISVVKTNDADGDGIFHDSEVANSPGQAVTFQVVITNTSSDSIVIDSVQDAFDAQTLAECPTLLTTTLAPGASVTCTFTVDNYAPAAGTSLTDTVTVGGHQTPGGTPVSGSDTSTVTTKNPKTPGPDLAIVKQADLAKVKAGDTLTYTLSVSNVGDGPTTGTVAVFDTVPSGLDLVSVSGTNWACSNSGADITCTWEGGVVNPGDVLPDITVVTTVNSTASVVVVNTGVVSTPGDTNPLNNRSTVKTPVTQVLGEKVTKPKTPTTVLPFTGDRTGQLLPVGLLAVLVGLLLMVTGRRRRRTA